MAHIAMPPGCRPGIQGLMQLRPDTAAPLRALAETLLRGPSPLSRGERELIAAFVSTRNDCSFCAGSHAAYAGAQIDGGSDLVTAVCRDFTTAPIPEKLRRLLTIAEQVQRGGKAVSAEAVAAARAAGADDSAIHDTVLIAAAFCMYNRYVDGLATWAPDDPAVYAAMAPHIVEHGYLRPRA
jgi:uncharacterized peroxidase-related enzyme